MTTYWDDITEAYHRVTHVTCDQFHYGPLLPGDADLGLLPRPVDGLKCLELGGGGGQNSIYLASLGATGTAVDAAREHIHFGQTLAKERHADVTCELWDMDTQNPDWTGQFDWVHSAYALPFAADQTQASHYYSEAWRPLHPRLSRIPVVVIILAQKLEKK